VPAETPAPVLYGLGGRSTNNPFRIELEGWLELLRNSRASGRRLRPARYV
jgi:hypothetical protein